MQLAQMNWQEARVTDINEPWEPALETALTPEPLDGALAGAPHFESARLLRWSVWIAAVIVAISGASLYATGWWFHRDAGRTSPFPIRPDVTAALAELSARIAAIPDAPPADQDDTQQASSAPGAPAAPAKAANGEHRAEHGRQATASTSERAATEHPPQRKVSFWARLRHFFHHTDERRDRTRHYEEVYQKP
jgi:hypothetical protein